MCYPCNVINQCYQSDHWHFRTVMTINVKQNCFKTELLILRKFRKCMLYPEILNKIMFVSWIPAELLFLGKIMLRKLRKLSELKDNDNTKIIRKYLNIVFFIAMLNERDLGVSHRLRSKYKTVQLVSLQNIDFFSWFQVSFFYILKTRGFLRLWQFVLYKRQNF